MGMPEAKSRASFRARLNLMNAFATVDTVNVILSGEGGGELMEIVVVDERESKRERRAQLGLEDDGTEIKCNK
jgi:hypothetical protein